MPAGIVTLGNTGGFDGTIGINVIAHTGFAVVSAVASAIFRR